WCLHGESELRENLVQMVIRDTFPANFAAYVLARGADLHADWRVIAAAAGLTPAEAAVVDARMTSDRNALIAAEFEYVSQTLGVIDGSPSFFWESQRIGDLASVRAFEAIDLAASGSCGSAPGAAHDLAPSLSEPPVAVP
ncbi:MAG TPA: hypothetical protein VK157_03535, partial [Phycisphaerales bacterium]|nr:hypothetical protein [Phycisphaerales bacterium]